MATYFAGRGQGEGTRMVFVPMTGIDNAPAKTFGVLWYWGL